MANLGKLWAGQVYGTNTGKLFVDLESDTNELGGKLHFMDTDFGPVVYAIKGSFDGSAVQLTGTAIQVPPHIQTGDIAVNGSLMPQGELRGQWSSTLGTCGTFVLFPHSLPTKPQSSVPEQIYAARHSVGALRLYADDVRELAETLKKDFTIGRIVATYKLGGVDTTKFYEAFEQDFPKLDRLPYLKLLIQEPEAHGINKLAMVEINSFGTNDILVQGIQDSWVIGKAESIKRLVRKFEKGLATNIKRLGVGVNQFIFLGALVAFPELSWPKRAIFAVSIVAVLLALTWFHRQFVPGAIIYVTSPKPNWLARAWPSALSWFMSIVASVLSAYIFYLLTRV